MTANKQHDDTKILLIVAGAVVTGAAVLAFLAGTAGDGAPEAAPTASTRGAPVEQTATVRPALVEATSSGLTEPAIEVARLERFGESTATPNVEVPDATPPTFEIAAGENLVDGGLAAWNERDYDRASAYFAAQTEARQSDAWAHYMLGLSLWKADRADEAVASMRRSAELDPAFIRTPINLSRIENDRGDYQAALKAAQAAVAIDGNNAEARFLEGRSLNNLGQRDEAVATLETSIALDDANGYVHNLLGLIRLVQGDSVSAADTLERAATLEPEVSFIHNNLGMALEHCGERDAAVAAYRRAVELDAGSAKAVRNLARLEPTIPASADESVAVAEEPEGAAEVVETADAGTLD